MRLTLIKAFHMGKPRYITEMFRLFKNEYDMYSLIPPYPLYPIQGIGLDSLLLGFFLISSTCNYYLIVNIKL